MSTVINVQGINEAVAASSTEDVAEGSAATYPGQPVIPTQAAEALNVVSGSASDTSAGTGARTVRVEGLNATGDWTEEVITLNGTTPVVTTSTWLRVVRAYIVAAGSGATNAGAITVKHNTTTANVFAVIKAGRGMSMNAVFTVPAGKTARLTSWAVQNYSNPATAAAEGIAELLARPTGTNQGWRVLRQLSAPAVPTKKVRDLIEGPGLRLSALTDIKVRFTQGASAVTDLVVADLNISYS